MSVNRIKITHASIKPSEISGSHDGEYEDDIFLGYSLVEADRCLRCAYCDVAIALMMEAESTSETSVYFN
jgi:hypothetical protein